MTKLEFDLQDAIYRIIAGQPGSTSADYAKAAAEVAKRYIEKALRDSTQETFMGSAGLMTKVQDLFVSTWLKENGVI